jgi:hypothetical protein
MRVIDELPKQGDRDPWLNVQNYKNDIRILIDDPIEDGALHFTGAKTLAEAAQ